MLQTAAVFIALIFMLMLKSLVMVAQTIWYCIWWLWIKISMFVQCKINDWRKL